MGWKEFMLGLFSQILPIMVAYLFDYVMTGVQNGGF